MAGQPTGKARNGGTRLDTRVGVTNSDTGRFLTRDPIKDGRNWYGYGENDPVRQFDSDGYLPIIVIAIVVAAVIYVVAKKGAERLRNYTKPEKESKPRIKIKEDGRMQFFAMILRNLRVRRCPEKNIIIPFTVTEQKTTVSQLTWQQMCSSEDGRSIAILEARARRANLSVVRGALATLLNNHTLGISLGTAALCASVAVLKGCGTLKKYPYPGYPIVDSVGFKAKSLVGADVMSTGERIDYIIWLNSRPAHVKLRHDHDMFRICDARLVSTSASEGSWVIQSSVDKNSKVNDIVLEIDGIERDFRLIESEQDFPLSNKLFPLADAPEPPDPAFSIGRYEIEENVEVMELPSWADYCLSIKTKDGWKVIYIDVDQL